MWNLLWNILFELNISISNQIPFYFTVTAWKKCVYNIKKTYFIFECTLMTDSGHATFSLANKPSRIMTIHSRRTVKLGSVCTRIADIAFICIRCGESPYHCFYWFLIQTPPIQPLLAGELKDLVHISIKRGIPILWLT